MTREPNPGDLLRTRQSDERDRRQQIHARVASDRKKHPAAESDSRNFRALVFARNFDHGTWSVLCHLFPDADIPVVQLSIDDTQPPRFHYDTGTRLAPLRDEGVLVMGSGNLVHNLHAYAWGRHPVEAFDWAVRFETRARDMLTAGNDEPLIDYESLGQDATLSAPTPDHYLPLLYVMGARNKEDKVTFPVEGIDGGSVSMLTVQFG